MTKAQQTARNEAIAKLRGWLKPGDTVNTILRHVSSSGMSRAVSIIVCIDGSPVDLSYWAARAMDYKIDQRHGGLKCGGCGSDAGYDLTYNLARTLFGQHFTCIGQGCPSNDHTNGDRDHTPHQHSDGGYAFKHRWL